MPMMITSREVLLRCTRKEPGTNNVLYLGHSVNHEKYPLRNDRVRMLSLYMMYLE